MLWRCPHCHLTHEIFKWLKITAKQFGISEDFAHYYPVRYCPGCGCMSSWQDIKKANKLH